MEQKPIVKVCRSVGGISRLASLLRVTSPTVSQWVSGRRQVPAERCPEIEQVVGGLVRCEDLRPDVNWAYLRGTNCPVPEPNQEEAPPAHALACTTQSVRLTAGEPHQEAA